MCTTCFPINYCNIRIMSFILYLVILLVTLFLLVIIYNVIVNLVTMIVFKGAFYAESSPERARNVVELADTRPGQKIADIGSGDGRLVIEFAKLGLDAVGYEINPWLVLVSRTRIKKLGLQDKAKIYWRNFWNVDLSQFDTVVVYAIGYAMDKLEEKFKNEMRSGSKIISVYFKFSDLEIKKSLGDVHLY